MRIGLLIKDIEYRRALAERISDYDNDILLDVISDSDPVEKDALILTDAKPAELGAELIDKIRERTVFLSANNINDVTDCNLHNIFKYNSVSRLLADISDIYSAWRGFKNHKAANSRVIACCMDSDAFSGSKCYKLASQIVYTYGGSALVLPLGYISEEAADYGKDINRFARLMYMVKSGRVYDALSISYTDSYGVSRLFLPSGRNPIAYLDGDDLDRLILSVSSIFDTVILDVSTCYREENLSAIKNADSILCFETGRRRMNFHSLTDKDKQDRLRIIKHDAASDEDFSIDEYIRELYGREHERQDQQSRYGR